MKSLELKVFKKELSKMKYMNINSDNQQNPKSKPVISSDNNTKINIKTKMNHQGQKVKSSR